MDAALIVDVVEEASVVIVEPFSEKLSPYVPLPVFPEPLVIAPPVIEIFWRVTLKFDVPIEVIVPPIRFIDDGAVLP